MNDERAKRLTAARHEPVGIAELTERSRRRAIERLPHRDGQRDRAPRTSPATPAGRPFTEPAEWLRAPARTDRSCDACGTRIFAGQYAHIATWRTQGTPPARCGGCGPPRARP